MDKANSTLSNTEKSDGKAEFSDITKGDTELVHAEVKVAPNLPTDNAFTWGGYFQSIGVLLLLLAALWGVVWLLRKYGRFNFIPKPGAFPHDGLRLEAQLPLGPKKGLAVVRVLDKKLLLGVTESQITLLHEIEDTYEKDSLDFQAHLEKATFDASDKDAAVSVRKNDQHDTDVSDDSDDMRTHSQAMQVTK